MATIRTLLALVFLSLLAACGGGGGGGDGGKTSPPAPPLTNFTSVIVDDGPAALAAGDGAYRDVDLPFVSVTLCVPGTTTCQTIDHIQVDTGSTGLRIVGAALGADLHAALPHQLDGSGNPVGECYGYVSGYAFGSVRTADFKIGGATVSAMPLQVIGEDGAFANAPSECTSGGGTALTTVKDFGANGVIGIGTEATDCGRDCGVMGGYGAAIYFDCPATGCGGMITRAANATAPFEQLPNPIAAMAVDNNGTVLTMAAVPAGGAATATGTLYFGIGTETNNRLAASATILTTSTASDNGGSGLLSASYNGQTLPNSFVDSGSSVNFFTDPGITRCSDTNYSAFYCPTAAMPIAATLTGRNGRSADAGFMLNNAQTLFGTANAALPGIAADIAQLSDLQGYPDSFDFGFPFFYGRSVATAIEGRAAGTATGPYVAF